MLLVTQLNKEPGCPTYKVSVLERPLEWPAFTFSFFCFKVTNKEWTHETPGTPSLTSIEVEPQVPNLSLSPSGAWKLRSHWSDPGGLRDRSQGLGPHCDFQTWQSTATEKHTDTLKALLQLNHLVSLEEMTEKNTTLEKQGWTQHSWLHGTTNPRHDRKIMPIDGYIYGSLKIPCVQI